MKLPKKKKTETKKKEVYDPTSLRGCAIRYVEYMRIRAYSEATIKSKKNYLSYFFDWCEERDIINPELITRPILERYQKYLFYYRKKRDGEPLTPRSQNARLVPVRAFFKWLARERIIIHNPASEIELPRVGYRLPKAILSQNEVERILNEPELKTSNGVRDRAIMEVLYSTGMRRMEICNLKLYDLDFERGTVMIRKGKGKKDRLVPIGERAISFVLRYLKEVRPELVMEPDEKYVFLSKISERFTPDRLSGLVRNYVRKSGVEKQGSCHLFRHTCATLMLENGADIRFIQEILGHVKLDTTQIYTRVSITKLKEIHTATHPAKASRSELDDS